MSNTTLNQTATGRNINFTLPKLSTEIVIMLCVFLVTLIVTLVTNLITITVILKTPSLRTTTNMFIVSLSASDTLYAMFTLGVIMTVLFHYFWNFYYNTVILQLSSYFAWGILIHSAIVNLILISIERWVYIIHPFWYQQHVTMNVVIICIVVTWVSAITVNLPYLFTKFASRRISYFQTWHGYIYPSLHTACCLLLATIYTHIAVTTYQQLNKISKLKPQQQTITNYPVKTKISKPSFQVENWKAIKLLIIICGVYFIFVSPYVYLFAYIQLNPLKAIALNTLNTSLLILLTVYHSSNFFVYALRTRQFRRALQRDFRKCCCFHNNRVSSKSVVERTTSIFELQSRTQRWTYTEDASKRYD